MDAGSTIGLFEIGSLAETQDDADAAQFQPELRTSTALHPDSEHIPVTRANGHLTSFVQPSGGIISGQGCLIDLHGWVPREMVIADSVALNVTIPTYVPRPTDGGRPGPGPNRPGLGQGPGAARRGSVARIGSIRSRNCSSGAPAYDAVVTKARERGEAPPAPDIRLEALVPYARGEKPVILHAEQQVEILEALELARELKLKAVISGGSEALESRRRASRRRRSRCWSPARFTCRGTTTTRTTRPTRIAAKLHAAGVTWRSAPRAEDRERRTATRNLPYEAATAIAFGLPEEVGTQRPSPSRPPGSSASPTRSGRWKRASAPTWWSRPVTCSSRRRPCSPSSSTASRSGPKAATPSFTPSTAAGWTRFGPAAARLRNRRGTHQALTARAHPCRQKPRLSASRTRQTTRACSRSSRTTASAPIAWRVLVRDLQSRHHSNTSPIHQQADRDDASG